MINHITTIVRIDKVNFQEKLDNIIDKNNSLVCVGLDSEFEKIPERLRKKELPLFEFNKAIIDATHDLVCAYKPNSAFYEAQGADGIAELKMTCDYLRKKYQQIVIILDAKRADIGSTNAGYINYAFEYLGVDAITLHPYLGSEAISNFLERKDKGCIVLCRTSNPGAGELQNLVVSHKDAQQAKPRTPRGTGGGPLQLYKYIAYKATTEWNKNNNVMLVVGATYPAELAEVRKIVGDMTLLIPGIGAQGGDIKKTVVAGLNSRNAGLIINSSRGIIFAQNPRETAQMLRKKINKYRQ